MVHVYVYDHNHTHSNEKTRAMILLMEAVVHAMAIKDNFLSLATNFDHTTPAVAGQNNKPTTPVV
eukprot:scaffold23591_cov52-Cyclotella_meneghiniana.AAC.3